MPRAPRKTLQNLTLRDPVQEIIDKQLSSQPWNGCICVEEELCEAIDEKYRYIPIQVRVIRAHIREGMTQAEIRARTGYCERQIRRILRQTQDGVCKKI